MLTVLNNDWKRVLEDKMYLIVSMVLTICAVLAAIVLTNTIETKGNIALVLSDNQAETSSDLVSEFSKCRYFNVTVLKTAPPKSELVQNRYDAIVTLNKDSTYIVDTIKNEELESMIHMALKNPNTFIPNKDNERQIGTNIIGYIMMFLLMQGNLYARLFAEDKEKRMIERVVMAPIHFRKYLYGHAVFMFAIIFIPTFSVIVVAKLLGVAVGFSLLTFAVLIGVLTILAIAFAMFLNSFFCVADTANMLGSSLIVLTSILAGSFYSFAREETLFDRLLHILPQKDLIDFANALEKGTLTRSIEHHFLYVILLSVIFMSIAVLKTRKDYIYHR
jgi:ABC-2 type transport system permease protein